MLLFIPVSFAVEYITNHINIVRMIVVQYLYDYCFTLICLLQLIEMGFTYDQCRVAVDQTTSLEAAMDYILAPRPTVS